ncbi:MAG: hypothetical protein GX596_03510 [Propionibacterium sp.]|nr:hypothetical protein [Propionibacterium sp.]
MTAYAAIDPIYRAWFVELSSDANLLDAEEAWQRQLRRTILQEGDRLISETGANALRGRVSEELHPSISRFKILDAASIWNAFARDVAARTPMAASTNKEVTAS